MVLYAACVPLQLFEYRAPFDLAMISFVILIGWVGILKHILSAGLAAYISNRARYAAIIINAYGVTVSACAVYNN